MCYFFIFNEVEFVCKTLNQETLQHNHLLCQIKKLTNKSLPKLHPSYIFSAELKLSMNCLPI